LACCRGRSAGRTGWVAYTWRLPVPAWHTKLSICRGLGQRFVAVLIYRLVNAKSAVTTVLLVQRSIRQLHERSTA
jgi:hypothetical protein